MRTFVLLFCTAVFTFSPAKLFSQKTKIVISENKTISIDEVFNLIKKQTDYNFIYQQDLFADAKKVFLKKGKIEVNKLIQMILSESGNFKAEFIGENIVTVKKVIPDRPIQLLNLRGNVTDTYGLPLPGVTILTNTTLRGTTTDFGGNYTIEVSNGDELSFSYVGFITQKFTITNQSTINVTLLQDVDDLKEVVVVGYGTTTREALTGSVGTINSAELITQPTANSFDQLLGGKVSGVFVTQKGGQPGSGAIVSVRGVSNLLGDNQPLYVIDGVPVLASDNVPSSFSGGLGVIYQVNPLTAINPRDIQQIDVLKDASAASIYGSRAANGVVIITTKRGYKDKGVSVNFNYELSTQSPVKKYDLMNADEYRTYAETVAQNTVDARASGNYYAQLGVANIILNNERTDRRNRPQNAPYFLDSDTDWQDEVTNNSPFTYNYNLSAYGGEEDLAFSLSVNATTQDGLLVKNKYKRYGIRTAIDFNVNSWLDLGTTINYNYSVDKSTELNSYQEALFNPTVGADEFVLQRNNQANSPFIYLKRNNQILKGSNLLANIFAKVKFTENFSFKSQLSISLLDSKRSIFTSTEVPTFFAKGQKELLNSSTGNTTFTNTLNYHNLFGNDQKHDTRILIGMENDVRNLYTNSIAFRGFPNDVFNAIPGEELNLFGRTFEDKQQTFLNSFFGRINYNYDEKYYLTLAGRFDGSDKFGPDNRWGFFPSIGASWRISNENFLKDSKIINELKLKASLGRTGNNLLPQLSYTGNYSFGGGINPSFYNGVNGLVSTNLPNPGIKWETSNQLDFGIDFSLFDSRFSASVTKYKKDSKGLIVYAPIPIQTGFTVQPQNGADMRNKGWEIDLNADIIRKKDFNWSSSFNIGFNKNEILDLNDSNPFSWGTPINIQENEPLGSIFGYVVLGVIKDQAEADALNALVPAGHSYTAYGFSAAEGRYKYEDVDGNGYIDTNDQQVLGNSQPDYFGGWSNTISYKNFNLYFDFQFVQGHELESGFESFVKYDFKYDGNNIRGVLDNTWSPDNRDAEYERAIIGSNDLVFGTFSNHVYDASFIRFKTLKIGYEIPENVVEKLSLDRISLTLSANNLKTWTNWPGLDPEVVTPGNERVSTYNTTRVLNAYPLMRSYTFGINLGF